MAKGKRAFIAGVVDDNGYGWAIAKSLAAAGPEILVGTWVPTTAMPNQRSKWTSFEHVDDSLRSLPVHGAQRFNRNVTSRKRGSC
ncbi:hypothetical protein L1049_017525 [Liquidambar formosana]|uniref:Enoyl-ACP reductase n=1 Tax=Liquidambar formosana TaxID=63359 RepID=A0AAP0S8M4_LIQFO